METNLKDYLAVTEKVSREVMDIETVKKIPQYISDQISSALNDKLQYAFLDQETNKIYESIHIDSTVKHILPFFFDKRFVDKITQLNWTVIDSKGVRFLFEQIINQEFTFDVSFLIIPKRRGNQIAHFSVIWGGKILETIDKEEIDFISTVVNTAELRILYLVHSLQERTSGDKELKRKAFELKEIAGIGMDLTSLGKEDFFGSFLLNVMGRALSKTAVIFLSMNENNTEYSPLASRGIPKKDIERIHITDKSPCIRELNKKQAPLLVSELEGMLNDEERANYKKLEAEALVPLISKSGIIGFLILGERMNLQPYSEKVLDSVKILSNQMVMAVENSKLSDMRYAFSRYVSHQVADVILSNPEEIKLGGERRKVTTLFADIRGFTSMAESMKPEDVVDLLNTYLTAMTEIVFKYEGTLDKYIGDCVMAVFGVPISHYNDTERAVISAIEMQQYVNEINIAREKEGLPRVEIGIGINTGHVIAGNMGSLDRVDYTVIGDGVNIAARLESHAEKGQILITKDVYEEIKYLVQTSFLDKITVKGREQPVDIYEVKDLIARKFISAVEKREPYIIGHFMNLAGDVELIGRKLGLPHDELVKLRAATMLIDVGRIGLSEGIFNKPEKLTPEEFEIVKSHVLRGAEYVDKKLGLFEEGVELVKYHHEFYDGSGYPDGLRGEEIPLWARIVCVVDSFYAMISKRPFREPFKEEDAMKVLEEGKGKNYDPKIVDIYLEILRERLKEDRLKGA
ncbi:MAG: HD domain-containing protein [Spirochaetota bacterium]|nr:MAG: HD domain-containing protein [Spirochaetota bacterium]